MFVSQLWYFPRRGTRLSINSEKNKATFHSRTQEQCESRGGRPGLHGMPNGICGLNLNILTSIIRKIPVGVYTSDWLIQYLQPTRLNRKELIWSSYNDILSSISGIQQRFPIGQVFGLTHDGIFFCGKKLAGEGCAGLGQGRMQIASRNRGGGALVGWGGLGWGRGGVVYSWLLVTGNAILFLIRLRPCVDIV